MGEWRIEVTSIDLLFWSWDVKLTKTIGDIGFSRELGPCITVAGAYRRGRQALRRQLLAEARIRVGLHQRTGGLPLWRLRLRARALTRTIARGRTHAAAALQAELDDILDLLGPLA